MLERLAQLRLKLLTIAKKLGFLGPLLVRLSIGTTFVVTGWGKLNDLSIPENLFIKLHIPFPHFNAILASSAEFFCGLAILLGVLTRLAVIPLIITMIVAIATAKWPELEGFTDFLGLDEFLYICAFVWLTIAGPGALSIDWLLARWLKARTGVGDAIGAGAAVTA